MRSPFHFLSSVTGLLSLL